MDRLSVSEGGRSCFHVQDIHVVQTWCLSHISNMVDRVHVEHMEPELLAMTDMCQRKEQKQSLYFKMFTLLIY